MNALARFGAEFRKLMLLFRADPRAVASGIIAPTSLLVVFWITFGNMAPLSVAVVDLDEGHMGAALAGHVLAQTSPASGEPYFVSPADDLDEAMSRYESGAIAGVVVIAPDFTHRVEARQSPSVDFHLNNYSSDMAKNLRLYLQEGIVAFYSAEYEGFDLEVDERFTIDSQVDWMDLISIGVFSLAFLIGAMFSLLYLLFAERSLGADRHYALSPQSPWPFWAARLVVSLMLGALAAAVNGALIWALTGLDVLALLPAVIGPMVLLAGIWMGLAALLALNARALSGAAAIAMSAAVIAWFLGGGPSPVRYLGGAERALADAIPNTWALELARSAAFGYPIDGAGARYALLAATLVVMMTAASLAYRRTFAHRRRARR